MSIRHVAAVLESDLPPNERMVAIVYAESANRDDDRFWRFGTLGIYYNPDDPAWLFEKRYGVGPTPNLAHPQGKILIVGFIVFNLALLALLVIPLTR